MQIDHEIPEKTVKEKHYGFLTFDFFLDLKLLKKNYACAHTTYISNAIQSERTFYSLSISMS